MSNTNDAADTARIEHCTARHGSTTFALYFVDRYQDNKQAWEDFLARADGFSDSSEAIGGFLRAVQDCWAARHPQEPLSGFITAELARRMKT
jgi:hypothetical protein